LTEEELYVHFVQHNFMSVLISTEDYDPGPTGCLDVASTFKTSSNLPLRRASTLSFFYPKPSNIKLNNSGARTPDLIHVSGRFKRLVLCASQRGCGATLVPYITVPLHLAASRRVPYQPQASPAWRCDSITTLPFRCQGAFFCGRRRTLRSVFVERSIRRSRIAGHHVSPFSTKPAVHY
jgi:hypothetical protein